MAWPPIRESTAPRAVPLAFWLLPCEADAAWLRDRIRHLARQHNGPEFEPHVTLHVAECAPGVDAEQVLGKLAARWSALRLSASATGESCAYFKALFIEISPDRLDGARLQLLRRQLVRELLASGAAIAQGDAVAPGDAVETRSIEDADLERALGAYPLLPHVSVFYGNLPQPLRAQLVAQHSLEGVDIVFDRIAAVRPAPGHADLAQVSHWELFGCRRLGE